MRNRCEPSTLSHRSNVVAFASLFVFACYAFSPQHESDRGLQLDPGLARRALVIGNGSYPSHPLRNPLNDAHAMQGVLQDLGFHVDLIENASRAKLEQGIEAFLSKTNAADLVMVHFSGHD